jgi:anti-sigma28 factor (negative regulator of flagellin synthesis)
MSQQDGADMSECIFLRLLAKHVEAADVVIHKCAAIDKIDIETIREKIKNGTYCISGEKVAERMLIL